MAAPAVTPNVFNTEDTVLEVLSFFRNMLDMQVGHMKTTSKQVSKFLVRIGKILVNKLSHSCLKVHAGVPIALIIFLDPLVLRINCLVIRQLLTVLFLNPESSILKP